MSLSKLWANPPDVPDSDRVAAAKALIELSGTTVEGLVEMTIKAGIQPSQFIEFLTKKWEEGN